MSSTGGKKSIQSPAPLTLSENNLVRPSPIKNSITVPPKISTDKTSYYEKLSTIRNKIFTEEIQNIWNQFPPAEAGSEQNKIVLGSDQMLNTNRCNPPLKHEGDEFFLVEIENIRSPEYNLDDDIDESSGTSDRIDIDDVDTVPTQRGLPFSPDTHVQVRTIPHPLDPNIGAVPGADSKESVCWMQRDAIQHYLYVQKIEERKILTQGAVYRTLKNDS